MTRFGVSNSLNHFNSDCDLGYSMQQTSHWYLATTLASLPKPQPQPSIMCTALCAVTAATFQVSGIASPSRLSQHTSRIQSSILTMAELHSILWILDDHDTQRKSLSLFPNIYFCGHFMDFRVQRLTPQFSTRHSRAKEEFITNRIFLY